MLSFVVVLLFLNIRGSSTHDSGSDDAQTLSPRKQAPGEAQQISWLSTTAELYQAVGSPRGIPENKESDDVDVRDEIGYTTDRIIRYDVLSYEDLVPIPPVLGTSALTRSKPSNFAEFLRKRQLLDHVRTYSS